MAASSPGTKLRRFLGPPRRYVYTAALVLSAIRYGIIWLFFPQFSAGERLFFSVLSFAFFILLWEGIDAFNRYLNRRLPFESGVLRRFVVQAGTCLVATTAIQTAAIAYFKPYYVDYFPDQFATSVQVASYGLNVFIAVAVNTAYFGFYFFEKWKKNLLEKETWEKEKALLRKEQLNAQYENLKNQLNPHFLFNSLSSLDGLIDENPALARQFLQQLAKVFRYVLQHKDNELVSLDTELTFIRHYVALLQTRFDGALRVTFAIADDALDQYIVPVTLQILLENAVKHNAISEIQPLVIHIQADAPADGAAPSEAAPSRAAPSGVATLTVSNPVQPKTNVTTSHALGLQNLAGLYRYLSAQPVEWSVTAAGDGATTFWVRVPLLAQHEWPGGPGQRSEPLPAERSDSR